ncbi:MAG TPA: EamA family transporter [Clostridia bacterium]|nr:EamA family transporter [Clostridia bacterium]
MSIVWSLVFLIGAAVMQAFAMALFKVADGDAKEKTRRSGLIRGFAGALFGISFPFYMKGLSALSLGVVQPVYSASMFLATMIISASLLKEKIGLRQVSGGMIIIVGIVIVLQ